MANYYVPGEEPVIKVLSNGDRLYVTNGGTVTDYDILAGGNMYISSGGNATDIILSSGGNAVVNCSGTASNVVINYSAVLTVSSGGSADIVFNPWSGTVISLGGANITYQDAGGVYYGATDVGLVSKAVGADAADMTMTGLNVANGRSAYVISGGTLQNAYTTSHGTIIIAQGGYAAATVINSKGSMEVSSGGSASNVDVKVSGALTISQAGSAGAITISSGGALYVQNNGHLTGAANIRYGGYFNGFTFGGNVNIYNGADAIVLQETANAVVKNTVADLWNNQTAIGANVSRGGNLQIHSGGKASNTLLKEQGEINIYSGGVASGTLMTGSRLASVLRNKITTVNHNFNDHYRGQTVFVDQTGGFLYYVNHFVFSSGSLEDSPYPEFIGEVTDTYLYSNAMTVHEGGSALDTAISSGGVLKVDGGYASKTFLEGTRWDAWNYYYTVTKKELEGGGVIYESSLTSSATLADGIDSSYAHVMNGGLVVATELGSYGGLYISNAGTADYTFINDSGSAHVLSGGLASHTNIYSRGNLYVSQGGTADRTFVKSGGSMNILSGGLGQNTFVNSMGYAYISNGGVADESLILLAGSMYVFNGGVVSNTFVNSGGKLFVSAGGTAHIAYMPSGWMGEIDAAANANVIYETVPAAGVYYGGDAYGLIYKADAIDASLMAVDSSSEENKQISFDFTSGQSALVFDGGNFSNGVINNTGALYVYEGGVVTNITANTGATINGFSLLADNAAYAAGLQVSSAIVSSGASASLFGTTHSAEKVWVDGGGSVYVESGSVLSNTDLAANATLAIASGATHKGALKINYGATVDMAEGSKLDLSIENWTVADGVLVNDLTSITGTPTYTVSASATQAVGTYHLADGASFTDGTELAFTITGTPNGAIVESLTVNGTGENAAYYYATTAPALNQDPRAAAGVFYQLTQTAEGSLHLEVTQNVLLALDMDLEVVQTVNEEGLVQNVTLNYDFVDFATLRQYYTSSDGGTTWTLEGDLDDTGSLVIDENVMVKFYAEDWQANSFEYIAEFNGEIIDSEAPEFSLELLYNPASDANNVTITVTAQDGGESDSDISRIEYSTDGTTWNTLAENIVLEAQGDSYSANLVVAAAPGDILFRITDKLGNTAERGITVAYPQVTADNTELTKDPVTLTADFTAGAAIFVTQEYSIDNGVTWTAYTAPVELQQNANVIFRGTDNSGSFYDTCYSVSNIDTAPPVITVNIDPDAQISNAYTITAVITDDTGIASQEYKLDDGNWLAYTGPITLNVTGEYRLQFRAVDLVGNQTVSNVYTITVDATDPVITHDYDSSVFTNQNVVISVTFTDEHSDISEQLYRINGGNWQTCGSSVTITENCTLELKAIDVAGNEVVENVVINNIDKALPVITVAPYVNENDKVITIKADIADAGVSGLTENQYYSLDNGVSWEIFDPDAGIVINAVNTVIIKAEDNAGNEEQVSITPMKAPQVTASTEDYTSNDVILTAVYPAEAALKEYSLDGKTWEVYTDGQQVTVKNNIIVYFRATDANGNISIASKNVDNIFRSSEVNVYSGDVLVNAGAALTGEELGTAHTGQRMEINEGGTANDTTVNEGGEVQVNKGGTANNTTINEGGSLIAAEGAKLNGTTINGGGTAEIRKGVNALNTTLQNGGQMTVFNGGVITGNTLNAGGVIILSSGAIAKDTLINDKGGLHVYAGGIASDTTVNQGGFFGIGYDAKVYNTTINKGGSVTIWGGGIAYESVVTGEKDLCGALILSSGAVAKMTHVKNNGGLHIYSGAAGSDTTVDQGGFLGIGDGGHAVNTVLNENGRIEVWGGGLADINELKSNADLILYSGAIANSTTILPGGRLHIYEGAIAYTTLVTSAASLGAIVGVGLGGTLWNSAIDYNAQAIFYDDSILRGWNEFAGSITVKDTLDAEGAMISFMINERSTADDVIIDNLAGIEGASYFLTVDADMASGKYLLAGNAADFDGYVTITGTAEKISCGGRAVTVDGFSYTLEIDNNDNLCVNVVKRSVSRNAEIPFAAQESAVSSLTWEEGTNEETSCGAFEDTLNLLTDPAEGVLACETSLVPSGMEEEKALLFAMA